MCPCICAQRGGERELPPLAVGGFPVMLIGVKLWDPCPGPLSRPVPNDLVLYLKRTPKCISSRRWAPWAFPGPSQGMLMAGRRWAWPYRRHVPPRAVGMAAFAGELPRRTRCWPSLPRLADHDSLCPTWAGQPLLWPKMQAQVTAPGFLLCPHPQPHG